MMPGGYGAPSNMNYDPALTGSVSSPGSAQPYDFASAIDPSLEMVTVPGVTVGVSYTAAPGMSALCPTPTRMLRARPGRPAQIPLPWARYYTPHMSGHPGSCFAATSPMSLWLTRYLQQNELSVNSCLKVARLHLASQRKSPTR